MMGIQKLLYPKMVVPYAVFLCLQYVEATSLGVTGLYRISGSHSDVMELRERMGSLPVVTEALSQAGADATHNVASLVKMFLRELPNPLLTFELYDEWTADKAFSADKVDAVLGKLSTDHLYLLY